MYNPEPVELGLRRAGPEQHREDFQPGKGSCQGHSDLSPSPSRSVGTWTRWECERSGRHDLEAVPVALAVSAGGPAGGLRSGWRAK